MLHKNLGSEEVREGILLLLKKALRSQILASNGDATRLRLEDRYGAETRLDGEGSN